MSKTKKTDMPEGTTLPLEAQFSPTADHRKAEDWEREDKNFQWQQRRCRECNNPMYTREPDKHDMCEECGWLIRTELQERGNRQLTQRSSQFVNPFDSGPMSGQSGSLPVLKTGL